MVIRIVTCSLSNRQCLSFPQIRLMSFSVFTVSVPLNIKKGNRINCHKWIAKVTVIRHNFLYFFFFSYHQLLSSFAFISKCLEIWWKIRKLDGNVTPMIKLKRALNKFILAEIACCELWVLPFSIRFMSYLIAEAVSFFFTETGNWREREKKKKAENNFYINLRFVLSYSKSNPKSPIQMETQFCILFFYWNNFKDSGVLCLPVSAHFLYKA